MGQLTIYLDDATARKVKQAARAAGVSVSKWVNAVLRQKTDDAWPQEVIDLAGAWPDFPAAEELRQDLVPDTPREGL